VLEILCRLTIAASANGSQGRVPEQHAAELARTAGSSLEKTWLDYVDANGHRRPDRGQRTIASASTCADFFYDDYNLAVFIDGPHHDGEAQRAADAVIDRKLDEQGYVVVRFGKDTRQWPDIFEKNADLFGAPKSRKP
jgi:very-short-patch-repair endonuclease